MFSFVVLSHVFLGENLSLNVDCIHMIIYIYDSISGSSVGSEKQIICKKNFLAGVVNSLGHP